MRETFPLRMTITKSKRAGANKKQKAGSIAKGTARFNYLFLTAQRLAHRHGFKRWCERWFVVGFFNGEHQQVAYKGIQGPCYIDIGNGFDFFQR